MNLQALYDLKERLEHATIAGTGLLHEDFRLRRAVEALAPLTKVNPVFSKISTAATALLNSPENKRGTRLLDVLSLVDAVVYTQGVSGVSGDLKPMEPGYGGYTQISYGELQPLLAALSGTGSGRTSLIRECWDAHPEYFSDFRVLPHVVGALGDHYGELADMIREILLTQGRGIIPLLKENFEPDGKMEMTRRVRLIAELAGESENEWFVSILPDSKKDIREAVIQALGLCKENNQLLLDLYQSERGKMKEAAMRSLAAMDSEDAESFLKKETEKKPNTVWCLNGVNTACTADMTAFAVKKFLVSLLENPDSFNFTKQESLIQYCNALNGKYSDSIRELWIWISSKMPDFSEICVPDKKNAGEWLQLCFVGCMLGSAGSEMLELAREVGSSQPEWFLCAQFLSDLMCRSPKDVYNSYEKYVIHENLLLKETEHQKKERTQLMMILSLLAWQEKYGGYTLPRITADPITGEFMVKEQMISGLDRRWIAHLANHNVKQECSLCEFHPKLLLSARQGAVERILMNLIDPNDRDMCQHCGTYYHRRAKMTGELADYLDVLIRCGWKEWTGLLAHCAQKRTQIGYHQILEQLNRIPISNREKANELRHLNEMVKGGRVSVLYRIWPEDQIALLIAQLESDVNA